MSISVPHSSLYLDQRKTTESRNGARIHSLVVPAYVSSIGELACGLF